MGWTTGVRFSPGAGNFFPRHLVQSYPMDTEGSLPPSPEVKRSGRKTDHSPPFGAEVENIWSCIAILP
jgi:hypothetical protein